MPDSPGAEPLWGLRITESSSASVNSFGMGSRAEGGILEIASGGMDLRKLGMVSEVVGCEVELVVKKFLKCWKAKEEASSSSWEIPLLSISLVILLLGVKSESARK